MSSVTVNGNTYSDAGESANDMRNGGHRTHLLPMLGDAVVDLAAKVSAAETAETNAGQSETNAGLSEVDAAASAATALSASTALTGTSTTTLTPSLAEKVVTTQADKSFPAGTYVTLVSASDATIWMSGPVTSYTGTTLTFTPTVIGTATEKSDWIVYGRVGAKGSQGDKGGLRYTYWSLTTAADPGPGLFKFNHATISSVAEIYIDMLAAPSLNVSAYIATWAAGGTILISSNTNSDASFGIFTVNSVTDNTGWYTIGVTYVAGAAFTNSEAVTICYFARGAAGAGLISVVDDTTPQLGGNLDGQDNQVTRAMFADCGYTVVDKGDISNATVTFDYTAGSVQTYTATGSTVTWSFSNWPPTGNLGELLIIGTNMGAYTHTITGLTWTLLDGTTTTSVATFLAQNGTRTAFQTSGVDKILLVTRDAGTTVYASLVSL